MAVKAFIQREKCDNSPFCPVSRICPAMAVVKEGKTGGKSSIFGSGKWMIDPAKCEGCGACIRYCPHRAVEMREEDAA